MSGEPTTLHSTGVWRDFGRYLRAPTLPDRVTGVRATAFPVLAKLFLLDLSLMALLLGIAAAAQAAGYKMPEHLLGELELTPLMLSFILVGAPVGEELVFRSWLSGRPGHVGAWLTLLLTGLASTLANALAGPIAAAAVLSAGLLFALWELWTLRGRPPLRFFKRHFRWFYYGSAISFAAIHLGNFSSGQMLALMPLVLPQFLLALILGYVRVHFGVWANTLFHAAHNSLFIGLVLLGMDSAS